MASLQDKLNNTSDNSEDTDDQDTLGDTPPVPKKKSYVQQWQDISANPQYAIGKPEDTRSTLQQAISRASDLYNKEAGTNDWAEVGQLLGKAAAQYAGAQSGMANAGKYGRNMGALDTGPSIDYGARSDRSFRKYQQTVRNAQDLNAANKDQFNENEQAKRLSFERQAEPLKAGAQFEREASREGSRERIADAQESRKLSKEDRDRQQHVNDLDLKDVQGEEKTIADRLKNAETLKGNDEVIDDLSNKDASKLSAKYGAVAGMAGIDLAQVKQEAEAAPQVDKSILGFSYKGKDPDAYKKALQTHIDSIKNDLDAIRAKKQQLIHGSSQPSSSQPPQQSPAPAAEQKTITSAQLQQYANQYKMTPEAARQYLESHGYKLQP